MTNIRNMKRILLATALLLLASSEQATFAADMSRRHFGDMPDGTMVEAVTLTNSQGVSATIITYGGALQSVVLPDSKGRKADVVLGHASLAEYLAKPQFMGATVGRVANRIAEGRFTLEGQSYQVAVNDGRNALHGGAIGFDKVVWQDRKSVV